jgi:hypothetical protein
METLIASLMLWITTNSAYDTTGMPSPAVVFLSPRTLTSQFYAGTGIEPPARPEVDGRLRALYDFGRGPNGAIFVLVPDYVEGRQGGEGLFENPAFQEILLHELVHHAQRLSGAYDDFACRAEGEREAYRLGGVYLRQRHAEDPLWNRAVLAHLYSQCDPERGPSAQRAN